MNRELTVDAIKDMTVLTIQNEARWMEFNEEMEGFQLASQIDSNVIENADVYLCGYLPQIEMELCMLANSQENKGFFYMAGVNSNDNVMEKAFEVKNYQDDFELNMLMYAITTQIMMRNNETAYREVLNKLNENNGCGSCTACNK